VYYNTAKLVGRGGLVGFMLEVVILLLIAGGCGFLASQLMGAKRLNIVLLIILGFVGAFVGRWVAAFFGLPLLLTLHIAGKSFPIIWAFLGSLAVVGIASAFGQHN
jgi:uncharacterized membrane protein YeaQ/YmgE (transglycosylase-associated protein family)